MFAAGIAEHPEDWHMLQPMWLADVRPARPSQPTEWVAMKVGLVCPYTWDVPGGVQAHVHDLALALIAHGP